MRFMKIIVLVTILTLVVVTEDIYTKVLLATILVFIAIFKMPSSKFHRETIWKKLWDSYGVSEVSSDNKYRGSVSFNRQGFKVSISEIEAGLVIQRLWLPDVISEKRCSGKLLLIPWSQIITPKVIYSKEVGPPCFLTFELEGGYAAKLTWSAESQRFKKKN